MDLDNSQRTRLLKMIETIDQYNLPSIEFGKIYAEREVRDFEVIGFDNSLMIDNVPVRKAEFRIDSHKFIFVFYPGTPWRSVEVYLENDIFFVGKFTSEYVYSKEVGDAFAHYTLQEIEYCDSNAWEKLFVVLENVKAMETEYYSEKWERERENERTRTQGKKLDKLGWSN